MPIYPSHYGKTSDYTNHSCNRSPLSSLIWSSSVDSSNTILPHEQILWPLYEKFLHSHQIRKVIYMYLRFSAHVQISRMLNKIRISVLKTKPGSIPLATKLELIFFSFSPRKLHKNYQMSGKINSHNCSILSVYKSFHQTFKYGWQRNHILPDLTGLEI